MVPVRSGLRVAAAQLRNHHDGGAEETGAVRRPHRGALFRVMARSRLEKALLRGIDKIRAIPTTIIQGRYDVICPIITAHKLHLAWPEADYVVVPDGGHSALDPAIRSRLIEATENAQLDDNAYRSFPRRRGSTAMIMTGTNSSCRLCCNRPRAGGRRMSA